MARQLGWLNAVPEGWTQTNLEYRNSRQMPTGLPSRDLPGQYLLMNIIEMGPILKGPEGTVIPSDWPTIVAYSQATGNLSSPWERETAKRLCAEYWAGLTEGKNPLCIPPNERVMN